MKQEVKYVIRLGENDRYRHKHVRVRGKIMHFSVQFETLIDRKWCPVVRYDTSHGLAHRDLLNRKGEIRKTPVFINDYSDALTFAESDLKANWEIYKKRFLEE